MILFEHMQGWLRSGEEPLIQSLTNAERLAWILRCRDLSKLRTAISKRDPNSVAMALFWCREGLWSECVQRQVEQKSLDVEDADGEPPSLSFEVANSILSGLNQMNQQTLVAEIKLVSAQIYTAIYDLANPVTRGRHSDGSRESAYQSIMASIWRRAVSNKGNPKVRFKNEHQVVGYVCTGEFRKYLHHKNMEGVYEKSIEGRTRLNRVPLLDVSSNDRATVRDLDEIWTSNLADQLADPVNKFVDDYVVSAAPETNFEDCARQLNVEQNVMRRGNTLSNHWDQLNTTFLYRWGCKEFSNYVGCHDLSVVNSFFAWLSERDSKEHFSDAWNSLKIALATIRQYERHALTARQRA